MHKKKAAWHAARGLFVRQFGLSVIEAVEIGDDVGTVLNLFQACKSHRRAWCPCRGFFQKAAQRFGRPGAIHRRERFRISKAICRTDITAYNAIQVWARNVLTRNKFVACGTLAENLGAIFDTGGCQYRREIDFFHLRDFLATFDFDDVRGFAVSFYVEQLLGRPFTQQEYEQCAAEAASRFRESHSIHGQDPFLTVWTGIYVFTLAVARCTDRDETPFFVARLW